MNCANWEERIALYMGGDLGREESAEVLRHLAECAGCQVFASGIRESLAMLHQAHGEEPDAAAYGAVRARVLSELRERERRPAGWLWWGLGTAAAAAALLLAMMWLRPAQHRAVAHRETPRPMVVPLPATAPEPDRIPVVRVHRRRLRRAPEVIHEEPALISRKPEEPLVVKMMTDDPDVVIYWITDTRGE
jgi:hypothetical protein